MDFVLDVISGHPVFASFIIRVLARDPVLRKRLGLSAQPKGLPNNPRLFVLDACSSNEDAAEMCCRLRRTCSGSKFVCLLPSTANTDQKKMELLCAGMDGVVSVRGNWENELRHATTAILDGDYWFPRAVLRQYITQTAGFLGPTPIGSLVLTTREIQVTNLVLRRFSNREISQRLSISVRTVKFHVSNVLHKVGIQRRSQLLGGVTIPLRKQGVCLLDVFTNATVARPTRARA